jgi:hypothetical protein
LLSLWDVSPSTLSSSCNVPPVVGRFPTPDSVCPALNTQDSRSLFFSTSVPFACPTNCTPSVVNACTYQLQIADARCGSPYNVFFSESAAWPISQRLADGQSISGPGRMAMDAVVAGGSAADACSPLLNNAELAGHWCVVVAGGCSAATKVQNCLGGSTTNVNQILGVIVIDSAVGIEGAPTNGATSLNPIPFPLSVPLISISRTDGDRLAGAVSSSIFTISKAIGPALQASFPAATLLTREERTGRVYSAAPVLSAYRFFAEPNRLYGWAFGLQSADGRSTSNVGLFDLSSPLAPVLLLQWSYAQLGLELQLDVSPNNLIFGQQNIGGSGAVWFWLIGNGTSFRFWNVTAPLNPALLASVIPRVGGAFVNRAASLLWTQTANTAGQVQGWRYQQAWNISDIGFPRLVGAFALDTSLLTTAGRGTTLLSLSYPTFDSWGSNLVSYNLGDNGVAFYNYTNPVAVTLAAYRDTSPSSCSAVGAGLGPQGAIVPSPEPNVWLSCRAYESSATFTCAAAGRANPPALSTCQAAYPPALRVDFVAYRVLPELVNSTDCEDGATVNLFFNRK